MKRAIVYDESNGDIICVSTVRDESATYKLIVTDVPDGHYVISVDVSDEDNPVVNITE